MLRVALSFDYDSPAGYRQSFHMRSFPMNADQLGADELARVLDGEGVKATFGIVAVAALDGEAPEHCPDQIRRLHRAGHEIASHSLTHRYLPSATLAELRGELAESRRVLEACIGASVRGFIPPFNRPMHFPARLAFSPTEVFGLLGRGRGRQSLPTLLREAASAGFMWSRVSFSNKLHALEKRLHLRKDTPRPNAFKQGGLVAIPNAMTGFGAPAKDLVRSRLAHGGAIALSGHPNQAYSDNDQHAKRLAELIAAFKVERDRGDLEFCTMAELAATVQV